MSELPRSTRSVRLAPPRPGWGLAELSVQHRALLVLIDGIGLPYTEAAEVLALPEGTVASRLHHAHQHVSLGPDGRTLAFVAGPDFDQDANDTIGDWELVVVDLDSGDETARIPLFDRGTIGVTHLDFDGTWAIVSRDAKFSDLPAPLPALAVNTATGTVTELAGRTGIVTLVDAG